MPCWGGWNVVGSLVGIDVGSKSPTPRSGGEEVGTVVAKRCGKGWGVVDVGWRGWGM